jgi:hypothetical protein
MTQHDDTDGVKTVKVHLLDCGPEKYGDALLLDSARSRCSSMAHPADTEEREGHRDPTSSPSSSTASALTGRRCSS